MGKFAYNYDYQALDDKPSSHFLNYGRLIDLIGTPALLYHLFNLHPQSSAVSFLSDFKMLSHYKELSAANQKLYDHVKEIIVKRSEELEAMSPEGVALQTDVLAKILKTKNRNFEYTDEDITVHKTM